MVTDMTRKHRLLRYRAIALVLTFVNGIGGVCADNNALMVVLIGQAVFWAHCYFRISNEIEPPPDDRVN
jgi:hypothetical protein